MNLKEEPVQYQVSSYEEERGKPMPSLNHSFAQSRLLRALSKCSGIEVASELTIEIDGRRYTPDLSVYPERKVDWEHDTIRETTMPLVTVEILSPTQPSQDLMEHKEIYLTAGVKSCWVVLPSFKSIYIYAKDQPVLSFTSGVAHDPVTGLQADLAEVFR